MSRAIHNHCYLGDGTIQTNGWKKRNGIIKKLLSAIRGANLSCVEFFCWLGDAVNLMIEFLDFIN